MRSDPMTNHTYRYNIAVRSPACPATTQHYSQLHCVEIALILFPMCIVQIHHFHQNYVGMNTVRSRKKATQLHLRTMIPLILQYHFSISQFHRKMYRKVRRIYSANTAGMNGDCMHGDNSTDPLAINSRTVSADEVSKCISTISTNTRSLVI